MHVKAMRKQHEVLNNSVAISLKLNGQTDNISQLYDEFDNVSTTAEPMNYSINGINDTLSLQNFTSVNAVSTSYISLRYISLRYSANNITLFLLHLDRNYRFGYALSGHEHSTLDLRGVPHHEYCRNDGAQCDLL